MTWYQRLTLSVVCGILLGNMTGQALCHLAGVYDANTVALVDVLVSVVLYYVMFKWIFHEP